MWGIFFGVFQCPPVNGCSTVSCNFVALAGGEECLSFYLAILNTFNILMEKIRHSYRLKGMCKFRDIEDMGTRGKTHN